MAPDALDRPTEKDTNAAEQAVPATDSSLKSQEYSGGRPQAAAWDIEKTEEARRVRRMNLAFAN